MKNNNPQLHLYQVAEIQVSYQPTIPPSQRVQIRSSEASYDVFIQYWDSATLEYEERFVIMFLNRANKVIGIQTHSIGGIAGTVVDVRQILAIALKANACGILLAHNHPSLNIKPSQEDIAITKKIKIAAKTMDISLLDHLIITPDKYYSFADEGLL